MIISNPWGVLLAAVVAFIIGSVWYSPLLFSKAWLDGFGKTPDDLMSNKNMLKMKRIMFYSFITMIATAFVLSVFIEVAGVTTLLGAVQVGLLLCFGFIVTTRFSDMIYTIGDPHWTKRPQELFFVNVGYSILQFAAMSAVIFWMSV